MYIDKNKLIDEINSTNRKVVIYGTGTGAIKVIKEISLLFNKVAFFLDSYSYNRKFYEKNVYSPLAFSKEDYEDMLILIASEKKDSIINYLKKHDLYTAKYLFAFENPYFLLE
ncbi:hypothetical protein D7X33_47085, partial [Butyricicoccus sp. 1XD8-22]